MCRNVDLYALETFIYDNGCNLDAYILNREPRLIYNFYHLLHEKLFSLQLNILFLVIASKDWFEPSFIA